MGDKKWWQSKTIWTNVALLVIEISNQAGRFLGLISSPELSATISQWLPVAAAIANIYLRTITRKGVSM